MIEILKGMKDRIFDDAEKMEYIYNISKQVFKNYGYTKIQTPILESIDLFKRGVGEETDVVSKEMYEFIDKGNRNVALRPEGTASVVRAYLEAGLHKSNPNIKWFYYGPMYRYEAPQKGRLREFYQIGVENFGTKTPVLDAEIIKMAIDILDRLNIKDLVVEINNIGETEERKKYLEDLVNYLKKYNNDLSEDSKKRLLTNPLRILDSKDLNDIKIVENAPKLYDYLNEENKKYFDEVINLLKLHKINVRRNDNLVRGLDYYSSTVFEIKSDKLGAQSTIIGGGRYDKLLDIVGNVKIPAIGFAMGVERLMLILDENKYKQENKYDKYFAVYNEKTRDYMLKIVNELRLQNISIEYDYNIKNFGNQLKKADKLGIKKVLIFGEDEMNKNIIILKNLELSTQETLTLEELLKKGEYNV